MNPHYLNHHVNRHCTLLIIEQDLFYDGMRKEVMMTPQDASNKLDGQERHSCGEGITDSITTVSIYVSM